MGNFKQWLTQIGVLLVGLLCLWGGGSMAWKSGQAMFSGKGALATVTSNGTTLFNDKPRTISYEFETPTGIQQGRGLTRQIVVGGSKLNVIYLPHDPSTSWPSDDPSLSPWFGLGVCFVGLLLVAGSIFHAVMSIKNKRSLATARLP